MAVSLDQIKKLREMTGVSMTACKVALEEANGDEEKAVEILRKKGEAKAADRVGKATGEGTVAIKVGGGKIGMVRLACETDFVARSEGFVALAEALADKVLKGEIKDSSQEMPEIKDACLRLGENIKMADVALVEGSVMGTYLHSNKKIGVIISLEGGSEELAKEVSMHVAAVNPRVISPDEISNDLVVKEKEIWAEQLKKEGKPEAIVEKIMIGKEKKFREENALIKQPFVKNAEQTVEQFLGGAKVVKFVRFSF
ncbi:MAG: translation elongation factor Ts [Candidatus Gracilibacteria bacterium]|jgi:elongation factor Ts